MAEQEVAKHTKKVYKVWTSKEHSWQHKLQEFLIEIFIIVFAVTISIWFHNISEKSHDRKEAKEYLEGLKNDLVLDIKEMRSDSANYRQQIAFFTTLSTYQQGVIDIAFVKDNFWMFTNETFLIPNISRFEALKYSGKINIIENKELLDEILNLYEEKIPILVSSAKENNVIKKNTIGRYMDAHQYFSPAKQSDFFKALKTDTELNYYFNRITMYMPTIVESYHDVIQHNQKLVALIEKEIK